MKAAYPYEGYPKARKIAGMVVILLLAWYGVNANVPCDYPCHAVFAHAQETVDPPSQITAIEVTRQERSSLVTIKATKPPTYTVVKLMGPARIVVDLPGFTADPALKTVAVNSEVIGDITSKQLKKGERSFCRIAIGLKKNTEYDVNTKASNLLIRIAHAEEPAEGGEDLAAVKQATSPLPVATTRITNLTVSDDPAVMTIVADSAIGSYKAFQLNNPLRMVVDIPGVIDELPAKLFTPESPLIEKVKVGQHPDKVRFAVYFKDHLPEYTIDKNDNTLSVLWKAPEGKTAETVLAGGEPESESPLGGTASAGTGKGEDREYTGQKISLDFKDADIRNILRLIADISGLNIVVSDNVKGKVTIKLDNVPWDEVLDIILETNNLGKIWSKSVMRIETQEQIRKISDEQYRAQKSFEKVADLKTVVVDIIYRDAQDILDLLKDEKELSSDRGIISVDPNLNRLVVTDTPEKIAAIKERIARYDDTTVRQVFIDAKIVQSIPTHTKEIGIAWGGPYSTTANGGDTVIGVAGSSGVQFERDEVTDPITGLTTEVVNVLGGNVVDLPAPAGPGIGGGIGFGVLRDNLELTATLTAMEKDEKLKIVSSPRVMSIDKNEAMIKQGVALPYLKLSEEGVTSTEFKDAVLELRVTPTILSEKIIKLQIKVQKNQKSAQTGAGGEPGIDVREAQTIMMVKSGETIVIGGIYEETTNTVVSGVPFFSDIPGVGRLFRNDFSKKELTELLIFVTTTIVPRDIIGTDA